MGEIGNEYYRLRTKHGRDSIFSSPSDLVLVCNEYFDWCTKNPLMEAVIVKGNRVEEVSVPTKDEEGKTKNIKSKTTLPYDIAQLPKMRPFTLEGLCNYIDISVNGFRLYETREGFMDVTTRIRQIIYSQKFEGAAANLLNPNIIARDLGLTDKKDVTTGGEKINNGLDYSKLTDEELKIIAKLNESKS